MANVLEILLQAKGTEQVSRDFGRFADAISQARDRLGNFSKQLLGMSQSARTAAVDLGKITKPQTVVIDGTAIDKLKDKIKALETQLEPSRLQDKIKQLEKEISGAGRPGSLRDQLGEIPEFAKIAAGFTLVGAGIQVAEHALRQLTGFFGGFVNAAGEAEAAVTRFNIAMASQGRFDQAATDAMRNYASGIQRTTQFSDEAALSAAGLIAQVGQLGGPVLGRATQASIDLAAALGTDLSSAAFLVAKAAAGSTEALSRYGIIIDNALPQSEKFAAVLEQINQKFGGTAAAQAQTYAGAVAQAKNAFGEFKEAVGGLFLPALTTQLKDAAGGFLELANSINHAHGPVLDLQGAILDLRTKFRDVENSAGDVNFAFADRARILLQQFQGQDAVKRLSLEVKTGNLDQAKADVRAFEDAVVLATADGQKALAEFLTKFRDTARTDLAFRLRVEPEQAQADLEAFDRKLRATPPIDVKLRLALDEVNKIQAQFDRLSALRDVAKRGPGQLDLSPAQQAPVDLVQRIKLEIPRASSDDIFRILDELKARQARDIADNGDAAIADLNNHVKPALAEFAKLATVRVAFLLDEASTAKVDQVRAALEATARISIGDKGAILSTEDLRTSASMEQALTRTRAALTALVDAGKGQVAAEGLNSVLQVLAELGRTIPERKAQFDAFAASLRKDFSVKIGVEIEVERAKAQLKDAQDFLLGFAKFQPTKLRIIDAEATIRDAKNVQDAVGASLSSVRQLLAENQPAALFNELERIDAKLLDLKTSAKDFDISFLAGLTDARDRIHSALADLQPLDQALNVKREFEVAVKTKDFPLAIQLLHQLQRIIASLPKEVQVQIDVDALNKGLKDAEAAADRFKSGFKKTLEETTRNIVEARLGEALSLPFDAALDKMEAHTKNFADKLRNIFLELIRDIEHELIRRIAKGIVDAALGPSPTSAGVLPPESKPSAPSSTSLLPPSSNALALSLPSPRVEVARLAEIVHLAAPRISVASLAPVDLPAPVARLGAVAPLAPINFNAPSITIGQLDAVELPAPEISVPAHSVVLTLSLDPLAPLEVPAPKVTARPGAPIAVPAPRFELGAPPPLNFVRPSVNVPTLGRIQLQQPEVGALGIVHLGPPALDVAPLGRLLLPAPAVLVPELPAATILPPAPAIRPQPAPISLPAPRLQIAEARPVALGPPVVQIGRLAARTLPGPDITLGQSSIDVPAPALALGPGLQDSFLIDSPRFFLGQPEALAPVELSVPVRVPTVQAPRLQPITVRIPEPRQVLPTVRPVTFQAPRITAAPLRISAPAVSVTQPKPLSISVPAPLVSPVDLKAPVVRTPRALAVSIPAPVVSIPDIRVPSAHISVSAPNVPTVKIPTVRVSTLPPLSVDAPRIDVPTIDLKAPIVRVPATPSITIPAPEVAIPEVRVPEARIRVGSPLTPVIQIPAPRLIQTGLQGLAAAKTVAEARVVTAARLPTVPSAPSFTLSQSLERAIGRLALQPGQRIVPRVPTLPGIVDFSRRAFAAPLAVNPPLSSPGLDTATSRLGRFFRPVGNDSGTVHATINALDSADFERYMRSGNGAKTMIALSRARRGA